MNVLWKCCKRTLKENRNRTIVTILGVALATGLITAAACLGFSLIASYTDYVKLTDGDAHAIFSGVAGKDLKRFFNNQSIEQTWIAKREGYMAVEESKYKNEKILLKYPLWMKNGFPIIITAFCLPTEDFRRQKMKSCWTEGSITNGGWT